MLRDLTAMAALMAFGGSQSYSGSDPIEVDPTTGRQPVYEPRSKRKAALLAKAQRRAALSSAPEGGS